MTKDPIKVAKKMIAAGKVTNNQDLINAGEELLRKHQKPKQSEFVTTVRSDTSNPDRIVYDDNGNIIGKRTISQPIQVRNECVDDPSVGNDRDNELLKKFTTVSPRTRKQPKLKRVTCAGCGRQEDVNPIHAAGQVYRCNECVTKVRRL